MVDLDASAPSFMKFLVAAFAPLFYLLGCLILMALLAYPLFVMSGGDEGRDLRTLVTRGAQVLMVLGLYPVARRLGFNWASLGFGRAFFKQWGIGFALGTAMLGLHTLGLIGLGIRAPNGNPFSDFGRVLDVAGKALATGLAVAMVEELIFRGMLFAYLRRATGAVSAVPLSALYFGLVHFFGTKWNAPFSDVGWASGLHVVALGLGKLGQIEPGAFLALFFAGMFLAYVRALIPSGLGICVGIHAGWVFIIKCTKPLTHVVPGAPLAYLVSDYDRVIGYLSAAWLAAVLLANLVVLLHRRRLPGTEAGRGL